MPEHATTEADTNPEKQVAKWYAEVPGLEKDLAPLLANSFTGDKFYDEVDRLIEKYAHGPLEGSSESAQFIMENGRTLLIKHDTNGNFLFGVS